MFSVGEKGDEYVIKEEIETLEDLFLKELEDIASICISAMK